MLRAPFFLATFVIFLSSITRASAASIVGRDTASTEYTQDTAFDEAILNVTNTYRKQHNATSLRWNDSLEEYARNWSARCVFEHSGGPSGENLASGYPNASASIIAWGHERVDYDFKQGTFSAKTGHFTQLVWKSTKTVGCGRTQCNGDSSNKKAPGWFVVCEYYPPGNVIGQFTANVQAEVPQDEKPSGPDDPQVPDTPGDGQSCPQGGVCGGAGRTGGRRGDMGALWVAVLLTCLGASRGM